MNRMSRMEEMPEEREILDTEQMLLEGFIKNLEDNTGESLEGYTYKNSSHEGGGSTNRSPEVKNYNSEYLLANLFHIHDELISLFESVGHNSVIAGSISDNINKVGSCIRHLGGKVSSFSPLDHVSGLQLPNLEKNAQKAIENTKQYYSLGKIEESNVKDDGKTIMITFAGKERDVTYRAIGTISARGAWSGNEAIDYVYTPQSGKLSVKAFQDNRWVDKSEEYEITWDLEESTSAVAPEKNIVSSKENTKVSEKKINEIDNDESEMIGFPIEEK